MQVNWMNFSDATYKQCVLLLAILATYHSNTFATQVITGVTLTAATGIASAYAAVLTVDTNAGVTANTATMKFNETIDTVDNFTIANIVWTLPSKNTAAVVQDLVTYNGSAYLNIPDPNRVILFYIATSTAVNFTKFAPRSPVFMLFNTVI